ncbi:MAG: NUDIX domain-containing protein [bacterium]|nr:NUDIX domain-containing protein [bacterium]
MVEARYPRVGIGVVILRDDKLLLGKRKGSHGPGEYAPPGGKLDYGESFEECARREVREETGLEIRNVRFLSLMNQRQYPPDHFVNLGLRADCPVGEPKVMEPEKCEHWGWYGLDALPEPLFATMSYYVRAILGEGYFWDPK